MRELRQTLFSRVGAAHLAIVASLALSGSLPLSAGAAPIRLLGVSAQGNALVIESTEPAAYVVKRPDPLTLLVELRNVSVANATSVVQVERRDAITSVTLEQGSGDDGQAVARVRVGLVRPLEYAVRSARNTIRLELTVPARDVAADARAATPDNACAAPRFDRRRACCGGAGRDSARSRPLPVYAVGHDDHARRQRPTDPSRRDRGHRCAAPPRSRLSKRHIKRTVRKSTWKGRSSSVFGCRSTAAHRSSRAS